MSEVVKAQSRSETGGFHSRLSVATAEVTPPEGCAVPSDKHQVRWRVLEVLGEDVYKERGKCQCAPGCTRLHLLDVGKPPGHFLECSYDLDLSVEQMQILPVESDEL